MFIFTSDQELWAREAMRLIMCYDHSLGMKDTLKIVYCFIILFHTVYILNIFYYYYHVVTNGVQ
jgi:hypothetical protein